MNLDLKCYIQMVVLECNLWHPNVLGPLVTIVHHLNTAAYLSIFADHVHALITIVYHLLKDKSSRIMNHIIVTGLQSSRVPLGCGRMEDLHHRYAASKYAATG